MAKTRKPCSVANCTHSTKLCFSNVETFDLNISAQDLKFFFTFVVVQYVLYKIVYFFSRELCYNLCFIQVVAKVTKFS
jgi:hypothetical protein